MDPAIKKASTIPAEGEDATIPVQSAAAKYLPPIPITISRNCAFANVAIHDRDGDPTFLWSIPQKRLSVPLDPYSARAMFISEINTPDEAAEFLRRTGPLRHTKDGKSNSVSWREFQAWQRIVRHVHLNGFLKGLGVDFFTEQAPELIGLLQDVADSTFYWLSGIPSQGIDLHPVSNSTPPQLRAEILAANTLDAMLATVYADWLTGSVFFPCADPKCTRTFEKTSEQERAYCERRCARRHGMELRRRDERASKRADR